jgi:hypothetical protein
MLLAVALCLRWLILAVTRSLPFAVLLIKRTVPEINHAAARVVSNSTLKGRGPPGRFRQIARFGRFVGSEGDAGLLACTLPYESTTGWMVVVMTENF